MPEVLPQKFEFSHGFCIFLHNEIVDLVRTLKECGALNVEVHEAICLRNCRTVSRETICSTG